MAHRRSTRIEERTTNMAALRFKTNNLAGTLDPLCQSVLKHFQLPSLRLLCFFDDDNPPCLEQEIGATYRGLHVRLKGSGTWPSYIQQLFLDSRGGLAFDNVIYLPGRTCAAEAGAVITFAHELEHFVQFGGVYKVLVANQLLYQHLPSLDPANTAKAWNIPHEQDAMIISKRVAEAVLGPEVVSKHAESRIAAQDDPLYWEYFQSLNADVSFDLLDQTIPWVNKFRPQLLGLQQSTVDFSQSEWWR
jgi:hypothetical protein